MKKFIREKFNSILRSEAHKAGVIPVQSPDDENQRLAEIERLGIMDRDLSGERKYNTMTQVASYLTGCKHSMINILESKIQQCKSSFGFNMIENTVIKEMPREISVCQYTLENPSQPLVIEDLWEDERTKNMSKMKGGPPFRFYAGSPLMSSRGYSVGTICVLDPSPKTLSHQQIDGLRLLSDQVVEMLEGDAGRTMVGKDEKLDEGSQKIEGQYYSAVTILFADFVGFTKMVENTEPGDLLETLNTFFSGFEKIIQKNNVLKVKTIGDCFMCVGGIPGQHKSHAHDVCTAAKDMLQFVDGTNIQQEVMGRPRWELRIGIHSGPVIAGNSGDSFDIWGDAVNIAARMESSGETGKIHITEKTADYLEGQGKLTPRGDIDLKNKGTWSTFFLEDLS